MAEHECIVCKAQVEADPGAVRKARPVASAVGETKRCATHLREFKTRQRKQARARQVERTYDITERDNHELYLFQGGRCWLCRKATGATKSLAVDHDHQTNEVRGRLCGPCNQFIGRLSDDPEAAQRLVGYLSGDTPYRRLKARQQIQSVLTDPSPITIRGVLEVDGELFANWNFDGGQDWYRFLVRRTDGTWSTARTDD